MALALFCRVDKLIYPQFHTVSLQKQNKQKSMCMDPLRAAILRIPQTWHAGTSSTEGERPQIRRSLRVRRARPMYVEGSDSDPEPEAPELPSRSGSQPPAPAMAKQGYLPSGTAPAPTPDACAFLDGEHCLVALNARSSHMRYSPYTTPYMLYPDLITCMSYDLCIHLFDKLTLICFSYSDTRPRE